MQYILRPIFNSRKKVVKYKSAFFVGRKNICPYKHSGALDHKHVHKVTVLGTLP